MVKDVFRRATQNPRVALVVFGWLAFIAGLIVPTIGPKLVLLSAARVLP